MTTSDNWRLSNADPEFRTAEEVDRTVPDDCLSLPASAVWTGKHENMLQMYVVQCLSIASNEQGRHHKKHQGSDQFHTTSSVVAMRDSSVARVSVSQATHGEVASRICRASRCQSK